jgi:ABC-type multidrug transport system fused ATPase/permease subunit
MNLVKKFLNITPYKNKKNLVKVILLILFCSIIESLSISAVFPLLGHLDNEYNIDFVSLNKMQMLILFLSLFFLKNLILIFNQKYQAKFVANLEIGLSKNLFQFFLKQKYSFFTKYNSSNLVQICTLETAQSIMFVQSLFTLITEILIFIFLGSVLLIANLKLTLISFLFFIVSGFIIYKSTESKIEKISSQRQFHEFNRLKILKDGFLSIREVKLYKLINFLIKEFSIHNYKYAEFKSSRIFYSEIIKMLFEIIVIFLIFFFIFFIPNINSFNLNENLPLIGLYVLALMRLLPSVSRIGSAIQKVRFSAPSINKINEILMDRELMDDKDIVNEENKYCDWNKIIIDNLNLHLNEKHVLKNIIFQINKGDKVFVTGKSGSGKSSLINVLCCLIKPTSGSIYLKNENEKFSIQEINNKISIVPQNIYLFDTTIENNIILDANLESKKTKLNSIYEMTGINEIFPEPHLHHLSEDGVNISGGQRKRVGIARALFRDFDILILDESTSELDELNELLFYEKLINFYKDKTIFIVTHNQNIRKFTNKFLEL